jgi:hypothetical protein
MSLNIKTLLSSQKKSINLSLDCTKKTYLVAVFTDENQKNNNLMHIPCYQGTAISGYPYDCTSDSYLRECVDFISIGYIGYSCYLKLHENYVIRVPICKQLCFKLMNEEQKNAIKSFVKKKGYKNLEVEFLQTVAS